ncbi:MAG TPA: hypothetical protein VE999_08060, partial [Gemmataceae bacterium]|nr:hypothetical protein [Gemmataceae bacterium]
MKCIVDQFLNPPLRPRLSLRSICVNCDGASHRIAVFICAQRRGFQHESILGAVRAIALLRHLDRTRLALLSGDFNLGRNGSEQKAMPSCTTCFVLSGMMNDQHKAAEFFRDSVTQIDERAHARQARDEAKRVLAGGCDPSEEKKQKKVIAE